MIEKRLTAIDTMVNDGICVVSTGDNSILAIIQEAVNSGVSATFYVSPTVAAAVNTWYWTPKRKEELGVEDVSLEEKSKIEEQFGLKDAILFSNRTSCENCGQIYGAFEFIQQGLQEHGKGVVQAVLSMENTALIRVNPSEVAVCPNCKNRITTGGRILDGRIVGGREVPHYYGGTSAYAGCCRGGSLIE